MNKITAKQLRPWEIVQRERCGRDLCDRNNMCAVRIYMEWSLSAQHANHCNYRRILNFTKRTNVTVTTWPSVADYNKIMNANVRHDDNKWTMAGTARVWQRLAGAWLMLWEGPCRRRRSSRMRLLQNERAGTIFIKHNAHIRIAATVRICAILHANNAMRM